MKDAQSVAVDLETEKIAFLEGVAERFKLPDIGKAMRRLINYVREILRSMPRSSMKCGASTVDDGGVHREHRTFHRPLRSTSRGRAIDAAARVRPGVPRRGLPTAR